MAKTWLSVRVELVGGRGRKLWPMPGRIVAVGTAHTFESLAYSINTAFARWDLSHLSVFTLADGTLVTDSTSGPELADTVHGPLRRSLDYAQTKVASLLRPGDEFAFTFDLGDEWEHRCLVEPSKIDPDRVLGFRPDRPIPYWGWGSIPDQYGRRWDDDDGSEPDRPQPDESDDSAAAPSVGSVLRLPPVDMQTVRGAIARKDAEAFVDAITGCEINDALQQIATGIPLLLTGDDPVRHSLAVAVLNRLNMRQFAGDEETAAAILALLRGQKVSGRDISVDVEELSDTMTGMVEDSNGGYIDLRTGDVVDGLFTDPYRVDEDALVDVESDPGRWLSVDRAETWESWRDMSMFAERLGDEALRQEGLAAIEGSGAFRRFRAFTDRHDLVDQWRVFSDDRKYGRAREFLADNDIRVI